jgi:hypothetical protein
MAATAKAVLAGAGSRRGVLFALDATTGLPLPSSPSPIPYSGIPISGLKDYSITNAEPQVIQHYGDDRVFATDQLAPTENPTMTITTGKDNLTLDAAITSTTVRTYGSAAQALAAETNKKGQEPNVALYFQRQALDVTEGSATFGQLRQYNGRAVHSAKVLPATTGGAQTTVDQTYNVTMTPTTRTFWAETFTQGTWGASEAVLTRLNTNYTGVWNFYRGTQSIGAFTLTHSPVSLDSTALSVWINGSFTVPGSVSYGAAPAFSLTAVTGNDGTLIAALIQTTDAL